MNKKTQLVLASLAAALVAAGCASGPSVAELNALTDKIVKASFRDQSHVKVERITATDEGPDAQPATSKVVAKLASTSWVFLFMRFSCSDQRLMAGATEAAPLAFTPR